MDQQRELLPVMVETRDRFMELVEELRPQLHRYCARMTGSVFDGEDVVQDTLAKAYYALGQMIEPENLRPWLFRIAHNTALDFLKRYDQRNVELVPEVPDRVELDEASVDPELVEAALNVFVELPPVQRSAIILKDVLGHSLEETAATMGASVGGVKAALSRARSNVARTSRLEPAAFRKETSPEERSTLRHYVELFNSRDWDGLRALLGEESRLDIVSRVQARAVTAGYFHRYAEITKDEDLRAQAGYVGAVPVIGVFRVPTDAAPAYFILVESQSGRVSRIRDFRYVSYIAEDAEFSE